MRVRVRAQQARRWLLTLLQWRAVAYEQGDGGMGTVTLARCLVRVRVGLG